jgi:hypothetical protein
MPLAIMKVGKPGIWTEGECCGLQLRRLQDHTCTSLLSRCGGRPHTPALPVGGLRTKGRRCMTVSMTGLAKLPASWKSAANSGEHHLACYPSVLYTRLECTPHTERKESKAGGRGGGGKRETKTKSKGERDRRGGK